MATYLVFTVDDIAATNTASRGLDRAVIAPARATLSVRTITSHVASVAADAADNVGRVILLLRAVILSVSNLAAVLARLILVVTQGSVQGCKLTQLVPLELVLALRNRSSLAHVRSGDDTRDDRTRGALTVSMTL